MVVRSAGELPNSSGVSWMEEQVRSCWWALPEIGVFESWFSAAVGEACRSKPVGISDTFAVELEETNLFPPKSRKEVPIVQMERKTDNQSEGASGR